ncbi:hypothetical protein ACFSYD_00455 [Paracoccus aerius]
MALPPFQRVSAPDDLLPQGAADVAPGAWLRARGRGVNRRVGRMALYLLFVLAGVLAWSVIAKAFFRPALWTQEMAQFTMIAYVVLGGAYSLMGAPMCAWTCSIPAGPPGRARRWIA